MNTENITRLEVIDETGRLLVLHDVNVDLSLQDDGRTLKAFVKHSCSKKAANDILVALGNRRGFSHVISQLDNDIQQEILNEIAAIIDLSSNG